MSRPVLVLPKVHSVKSRHEPKVYKEQEPPKHNQVSISSVWPNKEKLLQIRQSKGFWDYKLLTKNAYSLENPSEKRVFILDGGEIGEIFIHTF